MNCETARVLMEKGQDGPITPRQEVELLGHLLTCVECAKAKAEYEAMAKWFAMINEDAPKEFSAAWRKAIKQKKRARPYRIMAYAAAAIALLVVAGMMSRVFAPAVYDGEKPESAQFHVAGTATGDSGALFGGQADTAGELLPDTDTQTQPLADAAPMPKAAMDSAAAAQEAPAPAPMTEAGLDDGAPAPKADFPTEKELRRASSSIAPAYQIELSAQDHTALMEYISELRKNSADQDSGYHQQSDSAGRVDFFQMNLTMSELADLNDWLDARELSYNVSMPPETLDTEFVSFVLTQAVP